MNHSQESKWHLKHLDSCLKGIGLLQLSNFLCLCTYLVSLLFDAVEWLQFSLEDVTTNKWSVLTL